MLIYAHHFKQSYELYYNEFDFENFNWFTSNVYKPRKCSTHFIWDPINEMILQMENLLDAINKRETDPWKRFAKIHIINRLENERLNGTSYFRPYFCNCGQKVKHRQLHTLLNTIRLHRLSFSLTSFCHSQTLIFRLLLILNHLLLIRKISFRKLHTHAAHIVF